MPGRVRLTSEASVDDPQGIQKRSAADPIFHHSPKRQKLHCLKPSRSIQVTPLQFKNTIPRPGYNTLPPFFKTAPVSIIGGTEPIVATNKKKQISKPRPKKFSCTYDGCDKSFTRPSRLEEHMRSHTGERPFVCTIEPENCDKSFLRQSHLKAHVKAMHSKEKPYRCTFLIPFGKENDRGEFGFKRKASEPAEGPDDDGSGLRECGAGFSTNQHLKRHMDSHKKTFPYICTEYPPCSAGFRKKGPLHRHVRSAHLSQKPWACPHNDIEDSSTPCTASFDTKGKLGNHVAIQHSGLAKRRFFCTICVTFPEDVATQKPPQPDFFLSGSTAIVDLDRPSADKDTEDASLLLNLSHQSFPVAKESELSQPEVSVIRTQGMLGFTTHAELRAHIVSAHPPVCKQCGYVPKRQRDLRVHIRERHENSIQDRKRWICGWEGCGNGFTEKNNLRIHTRTVHEGRKPFACTKPNCNKRFGHNSVLAKHIARSHVLALKPKPERKKYIKTMTLAQRLTGTGYEESGRGIECVVDNCAFRFCRSYDLRRHLSAKSAHGFDETQVHELMKTWGQETGEHEEFMMTNEDTSESEWSFALSDTDDIYSVSEDGEGENEGDE